MPDHSEGLVLGISRVVDQQFQKQRESTTKINFQVTFIIPK